MRWQWIQSVDVRQHGNRRGRFQGFGAINVMHTAMDQRFKSPFTTTILDTFSYGKGFNCNLGIQLLLARHTFDK